MTLDKRDAFCITCSRKVEPKAGNFYYCEQNKKIYCWKCIYYKNACHAIHNHTDFLIDEWRFIDPIKDYPGKHLIMNKALLEAEQG